MVKTYPVNIVYQKTGVSRGDNSGTDRPEMVQNALVRKGSSTERPSLDQRQNPKS